MIIQQKNLEMQIMKKTHNKNKTILKQQRKTLIAIKQQETMITMKTQVTHKLQQEQM